MRERTIEKRVMASQMADVYIIRVGDRIGDIKKIIDTCTPARFAGSRVALKANYNSADPFPASTHIDTLRAVTTAIIGQKPMRLTLAERSGMGSTRSVLKDRGVFILAQEQGFEVTVLDELGYDGWKEIADPNLHWKQGFFIARVFTDADRVVQTCCLKTHRFGGHFTLSLKNSVGLIARKVPGVLYDFMGELHNSPHQRLMIAEINKFYRTDLIVMDASTGFATGGPDRGKIINPGVLLASTDRVAIDAAGIALLRSYGSTPNVMKGTIFGLEQITRAAELGIGVTSASQIRIVPLDDHSEKVADVIQHRLSAEE